MEKPKSNTWANQATIITFLVLILLLISEANCEMDKEEKQKFRIDDNYLVFIDKTGKVNKKLPLEFGFSFEDGGYSNKEFEGTN
jgi:hypothetical protein